MCYRERYGTRFDFITRVGSNRKSQTQYGISWNPEYDATNNLTNPHMSLSIGTSWRNENSLVFVRNEKRFIKIRRWDEILLFVICPPFTENGFCIFLLDYWIWIRRDWRGSNPQLPPWQGGALTDWTTIPGKLGIQPKKSYILFSHWISFELFSFAVL